MQIDLDAPLRFLRTAFLPNDWIAVLLKSHDTGEVVQRVGPVSMVLAPRFQGWLRFKNARGVSILVSVNAITPGRRSRTRESIGAVRHVFLDADQNADRVLDAIATRLDLPPSYVVQSSNGRAHMMWRVEGFGVERVEALQKHLARELGTDIAATSASQLTRLPGFANHKYSPPQLVEVQYGETHSSYGVLDFPGVPVPVEPPAPVVADRTWRRGGMPMVERARRYLAATPPAIEGQRGDARTFCVCCRLIDRFGLTENEAMHLLADWNARCQPPWTVRELAAKVRSATRSHQVAPQGDSG